MNLPPIPGLGWSVPPNDRFTMHEQANVVRAGEFPSTKPAEMVNLVSSCPVDVDAFTMRIEKELESYFGRNEELKAELVELRSTGKSNDREMIWNLQKIGPNISFKLHTHQNMELIYVIKGGMNEIRMISPPVKRIFAADEKEGPNVSDPKLDLQFTTRSAGEDCFIINEKGSMHMSYTSPEGAELLVLWSGAHGRMPIEYYPANADEIFIVPPTVLPF